MSRNEENNVNHLKRQEKEMTKILSMAWSWRNAENFEKVTAASLRLPLPSSSGLSPTAETTIDLRAVGKNLNGRKAYSSIGLKGWETFAADIGFVYNQFILWCVARMYWNCLNFMVAND